MLVWFKIYVPKGRETENKHVCYRSHQPAFHTQMPCQPVCDRTKNMLEHARGWQC